MGSASSHLHPDSKNYNFTQMKKEQYAADRIKKRKLDEKKMNEINEIKQESTDLLDQGSSLPPYCLVSRR